MLVSLSAILTTDWDGHHMGGGGWMWLWGSLILVAFVTIIALVVWMVARGPHAHVSGAPSGPGPTDKARSILAERLARGEIDPEEYQERLRHLS